MSVSIKSIKNIDSLLNKLNTISTLQVPLEKACIVVENAAKANCPVNTGILRGSITHQVEGNEGYIGTNIEYAPYVEIGTGLFSSMQNGRQTSWKYQTADGQWFTTSGQQPQPFLKPALDRNKDKVEQTIKTELEKELKKYAKH